MNNIKAKWITNTDWSPLSDKLYSLENDLGKTIHDSLHLTRRFEYPWVYSNLQPFESTDIVLDAGSGDTALQFLISQEVKAVHSLDNNEDYINWVNKTCEEKHFDNIFPKFGDILNAPYDSESFNKILCISVIEHIPKVNFIRAISELLRLLKPSGKLAITMDIVLEQTDKQVDINDFRQFVDHQFEIPTIDKNTMKFRIEPYNFLFSVICMLITKEEKR